MAISLTVRATDLRNTAARLKTLNTQLQNELNTMSQREGSLNGMWDGLANDKFHLAYLHDVKEYQDFIDAIQEYIRALETAAEEYDKAETANINIAENRTY